jgi:predicted transcriptional regulator/transcriptional regulator with XRE-family HTH domain
MGSKVRALRRRESISQAKLAERLGISPSYLNLIEHDRRPLPAEHLVNLAKIFKVDLDYFSGDSEARVVSDLYEAFSDPLFEGVDLTNREVRDLASTCPTAARAVVQLYAAYEGARRESESLAHRVSERESGTGIGRVSIPSEEVTDLLQDHGNYFGELESRAEDLWATAGLSDDRLYAALVDHLRNRHAVEVQISRWDDMQGVLRRFEPQRKTLRLSELLPTRSRNFQLGHQLAFLEHRDVLEEFTSSETLKSDESRSLARVALANYFAASVLMPYERFFEAARDARYDIEVIGRRFRVGYEQVCHRLTTLQRPGREGVPFHMLRIDVAGNISKRFSASGIRFARFSGACPRWNVFKSFLTPGLIRVQLSQMPDGERYFCVARTVQRDSGGYHSPQPVMAVGLGCRMEHAREMVYADGIDIDKPEADLQVGITCRLCERTDCNQRAHPSLRQPLKIDENIRPESLYTSAGS